jgi:hypothetical protein
MAKKQAVNWLGRTASPERLNLRLTRTGRPAAQPSLLQWVVLDEFASAGTTLTEQTGVNQCLIRLRRINIGSGNHQGIGED